ncbi:MAG TPA: hypothetical protein VM597_30260 [Gemmataceae bacterium]|nr:hypothetical protein [Gemmataceae bacterium]
MSVRDLIDRFAAAEQRFRAGEFLAPAVRGGSVFVRVAGVVCRFAAPPAFRGWGVFRPAGRRAVLSRRATLAERQQYLDLFPRRPLIPVQSVDGDWLAWPAHQADSRYGPPALVPVLLAEAVQPFDHVIARFDGSQAWFDRTDDRVDPTAAAYLRDALAEVRAPERVDRPRLTAEDRAAYRLAFEMKKAAQRDRTEDRLRDALDHAGAEYRGHVERDDSYRIEFTVDGQRHVSVVNRADLSVQLAGICLSGEDQKFDLSSLVGVLRQADDPLRIGEGGMAEEQYWQIHPPV